MARRLERRESAKFPYTRSWLPNLSGVAFTHELSSLPLNRHFQSDHIQASARLDHSSKGDLILCFFGIGRSSTANYPSSRSDEMAAMPAATIYPQSHVGFDSITSQIERKLLKRGFQFNVICVGQLKFPVYPRRTSRDDLEQWFY